MYMKQLVYAPYWTKQVTSVILGTLMSREDGYVSKTTWSTCLSLKCVPNSSAFTPGLQATVPQPAPHTG